MRPRGESSSSPSSTYVGQVAVQNPQCTQARRIFSEDATCGASSCVMEKEVCVGYVAFWSRKITRCRPGRTITSRPRPHAGGIEPAFGVEAPVHALGQSAKSRILRGKDGIRRAHRRGRANE